MRSRNLTLVIMLMSCVALVTNTFSQDAKQVKSGEERVNKANDVLTEIMKNDNMAIPKDLLKKAKAVVIFPATKKAGFIIAAQGGKGLAITRLKNGWSAPAFFDLAGGSVGFQVGGSSTDYIMLIMNDKGLAGLLEDKFEMGAEGSVAAGPVGRTGAASTNATMDAEILTYSRSKGAFAGVSLKGVVINPDNDMNRGIYSKSAREVLVDSPVAWSAAPKSLQKISQTVAGYSK